MICKNIDCGREMEYDEGEGNPSDGYICYECLIALKPTKDRTLKTLNELMDFVVWGYSAEEMKIVRHIQKLSKDHLRKGAIKWIKSQELQCSEGDNHTKEWIKHFNNITSEDLN